MFDSPIIFDYIGTSSNPLRPASTTTETKVRSPNGCWVEFGSDGVRNLIFDLYIFLFTPEQVRFAGRPFPDSISRPHACAWTFFVFRHGLSIGTEIMVRAERARGATRTHARSALAGHTRGARWLDTARSALAPMCAERTAVPVESRHMKTVCCSQLCGHAALFILQSWPDVVARVWQTLCLCLLPRHDHTLLQRSSNAAPLCT